MLKQLHILTLLNDFDRTDLAKIADVCHGTVTDVKKRYQAGGLGAILHPNRHRPTPLLKPHARCLMASFRNKPSPSIGEAVVRVKRLTQISLKMTAVRMFLKSKGLRFRRLGHVPAKADPVEQNRFVDEKMRPALAECELGQRHVFFLDSAHFVLAAFLCAVWSFKRLFVKSPSGRQRYNVLGALHAKTLQLQTFTNTGYINSDSLVTFLTQLKAQYADLPITIFLDNARYQRCKFVQDYAQSIGIHLEFLPSYSPNLNLIERVWKIIKRNALNGRYYPAFAQFKQAIDEALTSFNREDHSKTLTHNFQTFKKEGIMAA